MSEVPDILLSLVERFDRHVDAYRRGQYGETRVRVEFIDPLFIALGWDVHNEQGYAEAYKDVIHEDAVKIGGATKAPDYCFRIGGTRKFFLEAKKPSVDIRGDIAPAYQLRRYAWSAKLPLSILTDFEELAVYDCRVRPKHADKPSVARVLYLTYREYADRWDDIAGIFSKDAVLQGSFDKYAGGRKKRGTAEVDTEFLKEIETWREALAGNIALRNSALAVRELNFAVQRTIDRIIFLRMCEDRGVEDYGRLQALINGRDVYGRLMQLFRQADDRYNSGLFHFNREKGQATQPDDLTPGLKIDDKVLKDIFRSLYYPQSPYEFAVLPSDILGNVYEQFLGKVIHLTAGHRAKIEEKPEVRKAGGVYYTPKYIVDYIVEHTVGKLIEGKTPRGISRLRVLDPACGSGSFLVGAYRTLLAHHRDWYVKDGPEQHRTKVYQGAGDQWYLTTDEKKRILLNNIYGVDIDPQAVEVSKLNLLLCVLENENQQTLAASARLFHERALPDLGGNVKCGNSLIASDFYAGKQMGLFDDETRYRINAFDWKDEFFEIFKGKNPGFDAVIGNPPWGATFEPPEKRYLRKYYTLNSGKYESYILFIEKGTSLLTTNGTFGFIVPSYWISRAQTEKLRTHLCGRFWPRSLVVLPENVFSGVRMDCCIVIASKQKRKHVAIGEIAKDALPDCASAKGLAEKCRTVDLDMWVQNARMRFNPRISREDVGVIEKIGKVAEPLGTLVEITQGLTLYRRSTLFEKFGRARGEEIVSKRLFHSDHKKDSTYKKELSGRDVSRYLARWNGKSWVSYGPWLAHTPDERFFVGPRLVIQKLRNPTLKQRLVVGYLDDDETYSAGVLLNAILKDNCRYNLFCLMGLLNSRTLNYWYRKSILDVSVRVVDLAEVPICRIAFGDPPDQGRYDEIVRMVERMVSLLQQLSTVLADHDKTLLQRQITATDREIDRLVYELYGLTDDEIAIVEESNSG